MSCNPMKCVCTTDTNITHYSERCDALQCNLHVLLPCSWMAASVYTAAQLYYVTQHSLFLERRQYIHLSLWLQHIGFALTSCGKIWCENSDIMVVHEIFFWVQSKFNVQWMTKIFFSQTIIMKHFTNQSLSSQYRITEQGICLKYNLKAY